ncbi:RNA polymerase II transcription factor B subunit 2 [Ceratocystis platani]|uniref:RNA polymerase II transcription factor B subunit 2 n=1 Tax=Ceratocystis fimbriata f. sp. platani TaxID=88771 RepID=A0A0F8B053_CERFI|nr:RNA polymerase II transcription factor B subunit 2 [Ceratocystis platani]
MSANPPATSLGEYLERLPGATLKKLYSQPSTALSIFRRMLPKLAKKFVLTVLYMPGPLPLETIDAMVHPEYKREKDQALSSLKSLHMIQVTIPARDRKQEVQLVPTFRTSFREALEGSAVHNSFGVLSTLPVAAETDTAFLDKYARRRWDDILHYVVNSVGIQDTLGGGGAGPKQSVKELLVAGRLVEHRAGSMGSMGMGITQGGFTFLLQETNSQVWTLLLLWLDAANRASSTSLDAVDMLQFLFMLASMELGRAYDTASLTPERQNMLPFLVDIGLVYVPSHTPQQYFPTRFATTLTSSSTSLRSVRDGFTAAAHSSFGSSGPGAVSASGSGPTSTSGPANPGEDQGIIMETNYRIYAYTSNPLQIAVMALFCNMRSRFVNMVSGRLSRESVRRAIAFGITSDQIVNYLNAHAHEQMRRWAASRNRPVLPPTVVDQIRLWQLENERMKTTTGFLFKDFDHVDEYEATASYADEVGVLVWRNDRMGMFFASKTEQIRDFLKVRKRAI